MAKNITKELLIFIFMGLLFVVMVNASELESVPEQVTTAETTTIASTVDTATTITQITNITKNGFYEENDKMGYYINGTLYKGFLNLNNKKYYFDTNGDMAIGNTKIGNAHYYFDSNGVMKTGFVKIRFKRYYYSKKTGKKLFGFRKIGKYHYYLKKGTGAVVTGFVTRKHKGTKIRTYYDKKGHLKTGTFKVSKVQYKADKKTGEIYSVRNLAKVICQRPQLPTGCEITSWTMMANYAGVKMSKTKAADIMPRSSNPNEGFMGSPYWAHGDGLVIYPNGLKKMTKKYLDSFANLTGCSFGKIKAKLRKKRLVMVWVNRLNGFTSHTITLTGYNEYGFFYNDPWTGRKSFIYYEYFRTIWSENSYRAMSY